MSELAWWQRGVIYQIYPRSFQDSDGDGIGDLPGISARLEYVAALGVDAVWISPIYPSPMADFGYDVADYCNIDPIFGTLDGFKQLMGHAHRLGLKVLLDFVPNHSSSRHPWFEESRSSRDNPKRDWYLWRDPAPDGGPPNNWLSRMGGSAWEWDEVTGQYYYHAFLREQPDLNWRNPQVRRAMDQVLRFWLDRGVDGFRVDVLWLLIKDAQFRDNPLNPGYRPGEPEHHRLLQSYTEDRPEVHEIVRSMRATLDEYGERVLIGEIYLTVPQLVKYYGVNGDGAHMPFNFQLLNARWDAENIARMIRDYDIALPEYGWPNWVLGNHDNPRVASRVGAAQARVAAVLLLTLRGTPTLYYGDEIGMTDGHIASDEIRDPAELRQPGICQGRDPERTPMQWDGSLPNAGFTDGKPWLPIATTTSVRAQDGDMSSMLSLYRRLLSLRRSNAALVQGTIENVVADGDVLTYERRNGNQRLFIALNMGIEDATVQSRPGTVLLSTVSTRIGETFVQGANLLAASEAVIVILTRSSSDAVRPINGPNDAVR
ncbi:MULTISPECIES: alpha-amylase family glycosyl hydrolase [unclassified Paraburkholderia]|uniref:alpha-amylase family glycosyl hydrolase n=1 Tax=unclassified Paraburkholderia TaxID=2615204 RepID=UPI001615ED2D|nr:MULTISPECIES: alpha-amylase family glycosyl hydrolase [unclassified Paraburkholderia]MBB5447653.1 alpha-glucosidase [Paraburkholderia sp. WSM4177]MBB5488171.1 alpha-glucosidase [Paraburkholderia sp. WSM4180]